MGLSISSMGLNGVEGFFVKCMDKGIQLFIRPIELSENVVINSFTFPFVFVVNLTSKI